MATGDVNKALQELSDLLCARQTHFVMLKNAANKITSSVNGMSHAIIEKDAHGYGQNATSLQNALEMLIDAASAIDGDTESEKRIVADFIAAFRDYDMRINDILRKANLI